MQTGSSGSDFSALDSISSLTQSSSHSHHPLTMGSPSVNDGLTTGLAKLCKVNDGLTMGLVNDGSVNDGLGMQI